MGEQLREDYAGKGPEGWRRRDTLEGTIAAIAATARAREPYTTDRVPRAAELAVAIAREMGRAVAEIRAVRLAATVHDIGKIATPAEILGKPGPLSPVELRLVQDHVRTGYDILKVVHVPWEVTGIVLQHHERLDGSGYPRGIGGNAILPGAKILAVADAADAMLSDRPYRAPLGIDAVVAELKQGKGQLYDPRVVDTCITLIGGNARAFQ